VSLAERRWLRLFTLCTLYVAQGIPWGFTAVTIPLYLASPSGGGLDNAAVGAALAMTTLPYSFKWVWGPIIDAFTIPRLGRRRPWIVFAQGMMALTILSLILIPDLAADLKMLAWIVLIHTVFNSLQDVAVDALAVDLLDDKERGRANGLMYASKYGGGMIGAGGMTTLVAWTDLQTALIVQTAILLAIMMVPLLVRESDKPLEQRPSVGDVVRGLVDVFGVRSALVTALLMLTVQIALGVVTANAFVLFTQKLGWEPERYGQLTGFVGLAAGLGGSVIGGLLADRFGRRRVAAAASIAMAVNWLVFGMLTSLWDSDWFIYAPAIAEPLATSILTVSLFALCMDVSWARVGASQFTAYMAFSNISTTMGFRLAAPLTEHFSYAECYLVAAIVQVCVTAWLLAIDPKQTSRELPRAEGVPPSRLGLVAVCALGATLTAFAIYVLLPLM
jgi:PAT family beta-lactamase induction signal transducer AmpG